MHGSLSSGIHYVQILLQPLVPCYHPTSYFFSKTPQLFVFFYQWHLNEHSSIRTRVGPGTCARSKWGLLVAIDRHESHERVLPHQIDPGSGSHGQPPINVKVDAAAMTVEH